MITRRDCLVAGIAMSITIAAVALAQTATKPVRHSSVFNWSSMKAETTAVGERRQVFDDPTPTLTRLECHITTLDPGQSSHAPHKHLNEELMIVKEGTIEAFQEGVTNRVEAGGIIFEASNESHNVRNIGSTRATYFVVAWYPHDLAQTGAK